VHEGISLMSGEVTPAAPGMVFSIEPGIYLPGRFGVRIENLVAVTESGARVLHAYPRELQVL
jgi:Xaa-Pro aminopeptidase